MRNLYLLPTEKPSRLHKIGNQFGLTENLSANSLNRQRHIYITSYEEIKDCNCYVTNVIGIDNGSKQYIFKPIEVTDDFIRKERLCSYPQGGWCEKIILTTDPDLIADGVQAIDDDFLNWFIYNSNCDFVKTIITNEINVEVNFHKPNYKIIIPQEELKQETLEEVTERLYPTTIDSFTDNGFDLSERERLIFINGAEWESKQNKNKFSAEDMIEFAEWIANTKLHGYSKQLYEAMLIYKVSTTKDLLDVWFKKFKNK